MFHKIFCKNKKEIYLNVSSIRKITIFVESNFNIYSIKKYIQPLWKT